MSASLPTASDLSDTRMPSLDYQVRHLVPMIPVLSKCGVLGYAFVIMLGWSVGLLHRPESLLTLLLVLVAIVVITQRYRHTGIWGLLALTHLLAEEVAIIAFGHQAGLQWVPSAFYLMSLVTSPAQLTWRDFCTVMALCIAGPIVVLLVAPEPVSAIRHDWLGLVSHLPIRITVAAVIHHYLLCAMVRHFTAERSLADRASTGHLTGMLTRQRLFELGSFAAGRAQRHAEPLCALYLDVDHFKSINDTWGHAVGDGALVVLSDALADVLRPADLFGRLSGDEFAALLSDCGLAGALVVMERLKTTAAGTQTPVGLLMVSVGAAPLRSGQDLARLLADTNLGLMEAKCQGRSHMFVPTDVQPPANLQQ